MRSSASPIYIALILATLIMAASLFFILSTLSKEQRIQSQGLRDSITWIATQFERETWTFFDQIERFDHHDPSISHKDLLTRFDILWSRVDSVDKGAIGRIFMTFDGALEARNRAHKVLQELDPLIESLQPGDTAVAEILRSQRDLLLKDLHRAALSATRYEQSQRESRRNQFAKLYRTALLVLSGSLLTGSLLMILLFHRQRSLNWLRQNLEQRVEKRTGELAESNRSLTKEIDEHQRTAASLERLQQLLQNIFDSMPSLLIGVDGKGHINQWNREAELRTGLSRQQVLGKPLDETLVSPAIDSRKISRSIVQHRVISETRLPFDDRGKSGFADLSIYPLAAVTEGGAVIRIDDVTERIRLEELMIQAEKMISVGGLAAGMAHEINNPLAIILQNAQVVGNRVMLDLPKNREAAEACGTSLESVQAYLKQRNVFVMLKAISDAGERATRIVANMIIFKHKADRKLISRHLDKLLDASLELAANDSDLESQYDFHRIEIVRDYDAELPAVPCDAAQIQQVIRNLLKNVAQAMTGFCPTEKTPRVTLRLKRDKTMARIEVEDNGPGMNEQTRKRIFEPFYTTKEIGVGPGLGLSVSYFIITENHGGTLEVESKHGQGTKFVIRLPLQSELPQSTAT